MEIKQVKMLQALTWIVTSRRKSINEYFEEPNSESERGDTNKVIVQTTFPTNSKVKRDLMEPGRFSCSQCDKTFNSKSGLAYHMEKHAGKFRLWRY